MLTESGKNIRITELPETEEIKPGYFVPVDDVIDGTKKFDLSNLTSAIEGKADSSDIEGLQEEIDRKASTDEIETLESQIEGKVDSPDTAPTTGQVLMFDGTDNVWSDPQKGVYMLKYSEVTDLDDVDLDKATTIPTFILIDSKQVLVIGNGSSGTTITVNAGTIMRLEEVGDPDDAGKPKLLTFVNDYGRSATGGTYMTYGNYFVRLVVSKSTYGGISKKFGVSADIWDSNLFRSQQIPVVKKYDNARGPAESSGDLNGDANSLIVSFEDAERNKRRQLLPPAELASHDFSNDSTPEQIQFMGWGATSNRAGYKNLITAQHNYDSTNYPMQTPQVQFLKFKMSGGTPESDQVMNVVQATMKSADGQNTEVIGGLLVPSITYAGAVLQAWTDSNGSHYGWKPVNEVPASTSSNAGQVLSVNSDGTTGWTTIPSSPYVLVDRSVSGWYSTIPAIVAAGKIPMFYDPYTYEGVQRNILYVYQYIDTSSNYVFMGTGVKIPDFTPSPKLFYATYTLNTSTGSGSITGIDANGIGEETINSTSRLSGDTLSVDNNRSYKISISSILSKSNLIIKIEDVATADFAANVSIELTPTTNMTLTVKKWNTTLKYSVAAGNQLTAGKTYQVTAFGGCWTMAEFKLPD